MSRGRHRRPRKPLVSRQVSRFSIVLAAGGAGIAVPLVTADSAAAAPVSVWDKVAECQSGGDWSLKTDDHFYGGLHFTQPSWELAGGTEYASRADLATKDQQIATAEKLLAIQGPAAWSDCAPKAGLTQNSGAPDIDPDKAEQKSGDTETHTVVAGDTLDGIATAHDITGGWQTVYEANRKTVGDDPGLIFPGQELSLASAKGKSEKSEKEARPKETAASRSAERTAPTAAKAYPNNLDGWIREALDIMKAKGIPGTYNGIHRNIIRESGGDPNAINNWDINAQNGTPSIGLLQVIKPTFDAYYVEGTKRSQYDPVANIVAACNYAAARYGSMDNVNGPY